MSNTNGRQPTNETDQNGQGQSGYASGRDERDPSLNFQGRPEPQPGAKHRHNVGNYGHGSDSFSTQGGSMLDQNHGAGMQGHFGGGYGGYGHVGSYGADGGAQNHGAQGWQGTEGWDGRNQPQPAGGHRGKGPKNFTRTDERIRDAVCEALEIHDHLDASNIEVLVKDAEVTLSGTVDDRNAKRLAEDVAAAVSGVRDVHNTTRIAARHS